MDDLDLPGDSRPSAPCLFGDFWLSLAGVVHNCLWSALPLPLEVLSLGSPLTGPVQVLPVLDNMQGRGPWPRHPGRTSHSSRRCPTQLTLVLQAGRPGVQLEEAVLLPGLEQGLCPWGRFQVRQQGCLQ